MVWEVPFIPILFTLIALVALLLAVTARQRGGAPGSLFFILFNLALVIWMLTSAFESAQTSFEQKLLWGKLSYFGIAWVPLLWLAFAFEYTQITPNPVRHGAFGWLAIIPLLTIGFALTNDWHHLIWRQVYLDFTQTPIIMVYRHGAWFWFFMIFSYTQLAWGALLLVRAMLASPLAYRPQVSALLLGAILPWLANLLYLFRLTPWPGVDLTPYAFSLSCLFFGFSLFRYGLFRVTPFARDAILENIREGYLVLDKDNLIIETNEQAHQMLGSNASHLMGRSAYQALERWPDLLALLDSQNYSKVEFTSGPPDSPQYLEAQLSPWFDRRSPAAQGPRATLRRSGWMMILRNVTERRQMEDQLRESERIYRQLVNTSPVGIALLDERGYVTFASPSQYRLYGASPEESLIGQSALQWVHPEERESAVRRMAALLQSSQDAVSREYRLLKVDGTPFWGEITSTPLRDNSGKAHGLLSITRDVTERKKLELHLQRSLEQQTFINDVLQMLHRPPDINAALFQVIARIGRFTGASRVYLCAHNAEGSQAEIQLEWLSSGMNGTAARAGVLMRYDQMPSWRERLEIGGMLYVNHLENLPSDLLGFMDLWGVQAMLAFPIYGNDRMFGFLGIDQCDQPRSWCGEELELLLNVCKLISGAVTQIEIEENKHREHLLMAAVRDTASALNSTLNFDELLDRLLANLDLVVPHDATSIVLLEDDNQLRAVRWRGYSPEVIAQMRRSPKPYEDLPTYFQMVKSGEPVIILNTDNHPLWKKSEGLGWVCSYIGMPIKSRGRVVGFINLDSSQPNFFTPDHADRLRVFADSAGVAIENARLYQNARQRAEEMSILYRIGLTLTAGLEMNQVLVTLLDQCRQVLPIDVFYVALYDSESGIIQHPIFYERDVFSQVEPQSIFVRPSLSGEVIRTRQTLHIPDSIQPEVEARYQIRRSGGIPVRTYVGVPLVVLDQVVGVISMQNYQPHAYTAEQIRLLETIATQAAITVHNARLYDQMKQMAITDTVTRLYTRRHFTALGRSEVERALRYNRNISVLMVDIDHFKRVNDTYGHNTGDQVLMAVATACRQGLRQTDIVGRWGGEEFVIVLPEADEDGACMIAERIRRIVSETEILTASGSIHITVSVGAAVVRLQRNTLELLVDYADRALYMAKQAGRNQVRLWQD